MQLPGAHLHGRWHGQHTGDAKKRQSARLEGADRRVAVFPRRPSHSINVGRTCAVKPAASPFSVCIHRWPISRSMRVCGAYPLLCSMSHGVLSRKVTQNDAQTTCLPPEADFSCAGRRRVCVHVPQHGRAFPSPSPPPPPPPPPRAQHSTPAVQPAHPAVYDPMPASHRWICCGTPTQHANPPPPPLRRVLPPWHPHQRLRRSTPPRHS
jgi:hypothetical protein